MSGKISFIIAAGVTLFAWGCDNDKSSSDSEAQISDEQALQEMFLEDTDLEAPDVWQEDEDDGGGLDEAIDPLGWWRVGLRSNTRVTVVFEGDSVAWITRVRTLNGDFRLLMEVTDTSRVTIDKSMHNELVRRARAVRIGDGDRPRENWRIVAVTPEVMRSVDPDPLTHTIENVQVVASDGSVIADISDPLHTWLNRETLPRVEAGTELTMFVTMAAGESPVVGVLHPRVHREGRHPRVRLHDDGVAPDVLAGDGIFSASFYAGDRLGPHFAGVDMIDYDTIFDSEGPYDAIGWGVPYGVVPPAQ
ncbi:hypothetical protein IT157_07110 [bacterium]|nr:hypothetical protein [bacterium]